MFSVWRTSIDSASSPTTEGEGEGGEEEEKKMADWELPLRRCHPSNFTCIVRRERRHFHVHDASSVSALTDIVHWGTHAHSQSRLSRRAIAYILLSTFPTELTTQLHVRWSICVSPTLSSQRTGWLLWSVWRKNCFQKRTRTSFYRRKKKEKLFPRLRHT